MSPCSLSIYSSENNDIFAKNANSSCNKPELSINDGMCHPHWATHCMNPLFVPPKLGLLSKREGESILASISVH